MKITIAAAQYPFQKVKSINEWQQKMDEWVQDAVAKNADVLVFPEYGSLELACLFPEDVQNNSQQLFIDFQQLFPTFLRTFQTLVVKYKKIIIAPSFIQRHNNSFCNRVYVFGANGGIDYQDKLFLTRTEKEEWHLIDAPQRLVVFKADWGKFGIQMCYDSEFAIGSDLLAKQGIDLLIIPSCTQSIRGASRVHISARARAVEQQFYSVVAQIINDANWLPILPINYGFAGVYTTPDGDLPEDGVLITGVPQKAGWVIQEIDLGLTKQVRENGQMHNFKDHQDIEMMKSQLITVVDAGINGF
ncbi:MAG: hypothetical protein M9916_02430 [Crocinitomicaceae bacterium]|nr:hypothetical protein [Crocinitomicaceae bacterium]